MRVIKDFADFAQTHIERHCAAILLALIIVPWPLMTSLRQIPDHIATHVAWARKPLNSEIGFLQNDPFTYELFKFDVGQGENQSFWGNAVHVAVRWSEDKVGPMKRRLCMAAKVGHQSRDGHN